MRFGGTGVWLVCGFLVALLGAACGSGASEATAKTPEATASEALVVVPTATSVVPVEVEPTPSPVPTAVPVVVGDDERVAVVVAALESGGVDGLIAWDVLESRVGEPGDDGSAVVELSLCGWSGESVFDAVYSSKWSTSLTADGELVARELSTALSTGECLNTELIDSSLETVIAHDEMWSAVHADPSRFADLPLDTVLGESEYRVSENAATAWAEDGIAIRSSPNGTPIDEGGGLTADLLWRRFEWSESNFALEVLTCRGLAEDFGFYRGNLLIDDERGPGAAGDHTVQTYVMVLDGTAALRWRVEERHGLSWANCDVGDWPAAASMWRPTDSDFETLDQ